MPYRAPRILSGRPARWPAPRAQSTARFPLAVHAGGRYLVEANGTPLFLHADYPASIVVQLTNARIDTYLADRQAKGFTAILFSALEHFFSSQSPAYNNADGVSPFTTMTDFASAPVSAYWARLDYIVNQAKARNIACIIAPAYLGFAGTEEGWDTEVGAETDADLQAYGAFLANRYTQGNVLWCRGGDAAGDATLAAKQDQIFVGIRSVRTTDIITGHNARTNSDAYSSWGGTYPLTLNSIYTATDASDTYTEAATAYGRNIPFIFLEGKADFNTSDAAVRRQMIGSILAGACGHIVLVDRLWDFESPSSTGLGAAHSLATYLSTTGVAELGYLRSVLLDYRWWNLVPKTDTSLVTSSLGSGTSRIYAALIADNNGSNTQSVAMVYGSSAFTLAMTNFTQSSVRGRWFDPTTNAFSAISGSPFTNTGTQSLTPPGERLAVFD